MHARLYIHDWQANRVLEFAWWIIAWRKYSVTAVVTDQLTFAETVAHDAVVAEVVAQRGCPKWLPQSGGCKVPRWGTLHILGSPLGNVAVPPLGLVFPLQIRSPLNTN